MSYETKIKEMEQIRLDAISLANKFEKIIYRGVYRDAGKFRMSVRCALQNCLEILELDVWDNPHNADKGKLYFTELREELISML